MKRFSFGSLRVQLIILVLLAAIPALGITLYSGLEHREHMRQHALDDALRLVQDISETHDRLIQDARQILLTLSKTSEVQQQNKTASSKTFADIIKQSQGYTALFAAKLNGDVFASSLPITHPVNFADRPWFQRLLKTRDFVIGQYLIGRVTGKPLIALAHPVFDVTGNLKAILVWGMDLEWLNQTVVKSKLQEESSVTVIDSNGIVLFRYPEPEKFVGKSMPEASIVKAILTKRQGVEETVGIDGEPRLFGFASSGKGVESVHVTVGIPRQIALAKSDRVMKGSLTYLGLIALLALAAAWFMGGFIVIHPVNRLLDTTKQLANGDLTVRTGPPYGQGEIGQLAWAFDHMATSLELREVERRRAENEVISTKAKLEYLLSSSPAVIYACEPGGDYPPTFISENIKMQLGYDSEKFLSDPKFWIDRIHPEDAPRILAELPRLFEQGHHAHEYRFLHKNGTYHWIHDEMSLTKNEEGNPLEVVGSMMDITERKQAEENLRKSEEKYRTILENIEEGYYEVDLAGNFTFFNNSLCRILGCPRNELMGMHNRQYTDQKNAKHLYHTFNEVYKTRKPFKVVDWEIIRKDGTKRFGDISVSLIEDSKGEPIGFRGIARDITERKKVDEDLQKSKMQFQEMFDDAPVGYQELDNKGNVARVNRTELKMLGYSAEEMVGQPIWNFITGEEDLRQIFFGKIFGKIPPGHSYERCFLRKDGTTLVVLAEDKLLRNNEENITGIRTTIQDISERKLAEEALQESEDRYRSLVENIDFGVTLVDKDFRIIMTNALLGRWSNKPIREFVGKTCFKEFEKRQAVCPHCPGVKAMATGQPHQVETEGVGEDGSRISVRVHAFPLFNPDGATKGFIEVIENITEQKRMEQEKASLEEQLRQSQKVEAIGQLAGGIAHDFNNLLTVIKGYSQFSLFNLQQDNPLRENIEEIQKAADRASALTRQLLAFSRRQIMEMKIINLNDLIKNLEKMLHRVIGEDVELVTFLTEDLGKVKADLGQIEQVIMNVSVNARDAMPRGGKLTIETANVEIDEAYAHSHVAVKPGRYVMLSVSDTGVGMTPEVRKRVFEPFFTTKEKGKGTGLGLSMVYGIVKQSEGNIWVYSEPGQGTTLKIYLPWVEEAPEEVTDKVEKGEFLQGGETILVVEDDEVVQKLTVKILRNQGYKVLEAPCGENALAVFDKLKGSVDLMITDVVMPGMSGRDLVKLLVPLHPEMKVLYMSGYTDNAIVHHGVLEKGVNFIQKPFTPKGLARKVREVLSEVPRSRAAGHLIL